MSTEQLFSISSLFVMPFWAMMILLPHWSVTKRIMNSPFISIAPAIMYAVFVLPRFGEIFLAVSNPTLTGMAELMGSPEGALIAWVHFLAFDLFVGRWVYLDSHKQKISAWIVSPILFFTLMLGPVGYLAYLGVKTAVSLRPASNTHSSTKLST